MPPSTPARRPRSVAPIDGNPNPQPSGGAVRLPRGRDRSRAIRDFNLSLPAQGLRHGAKLKG